MNGKRSICTVIAAAVIVIMTVHAYAAPKRNAAPESSAKERIRFIQNEFDLGERNARLWMFSWVYVQAALAMGNYGLLATYYTSSSKALQQKWVTYAVGGVRSSLSMGFLLIQGLPTVFAGKRLAALPESTPEEINKKLSEAERLLEMSANRESRGHSWLPHVLSFLVNTTGGVVIWRCQKNKKSWQDALVHFTTGMVVGEIQIWTMPTRSIKAWDEYRGKYSTPETGQSNDIYDTKWFITFTGSGIAAGMYF